MSAPVGIGAGDLALLLKALGELISVLRKEAVDSFKKFSESYQRFRRLTEALRKFIQGKNLQHDPDIKCSLRHTQKFLRDSFKSISEFGPYLGEGRVRNSLIGAVKKFKWVKHTGTLERLEQEMDKELQLLYLLVATKPT
jgi:hypothetical protein